MQHAHKHISRRRRASILTPMYAAYAGSGEKAGGATQVVGTPRTHPHRAAGAPPGGQRWVERWVERATERARRSERETGGSAGASADMRVTAAGALAAWAFSVACVQDSAGASSPLRVCSRLRCISASLPLCLSASLPLYLMGLGRAQASTIVGCRRGTSSAPTSTTRVSSTSTISSCSLGCSAAGVCVCVCVCVRARAREYRTPRFSHSFPHTT